MRAHHYLILVLAACGTEAATPQPGGELSPPPPDGGQQLASDTYRLAPGEEKYMCYQFYAPNEHIAITKVAAIEAVGIHHLALFQAYGRDEKPVEPHECNTLIKTTWLPIWASGAGSKEMVLPANTGMVIDGGTQYIMQLHLQNTGDTDLDVRAGVNLTYDHAPENLTPAGIFALGKQNFQIPPSTTDFQTPVDCLSTRTMHVFAAFPHMHKIGTKLEATRAIGDGAPAPFYKIDPWTFGDQPIDMLDSTVNIGDKLHMTCHFDNHGATAVDYGESSDQEMCYFVMYYYPFDHLDGCIVN